MGCQRNGLINVWLAQNTCDVVGSVGNKVLGVTLTRRLTWCPHYHWNSNETLIVGLDFFLSVCRDRRFPWHLRYSTMLRTPSILYRGRIFYDLFTDTLLTYSFLLYVNITLSSLKYEEAQGLIESSLWSTLVSFNKGVTISFDPIWSSVWYSVKHWNYISNY